MKTTIIMADGAHTPERAITPLRLTAEAAQVRVGKRVDLELRRAWWARSLGIALVLAPSDAEWQEETEALWRRCLGV
jgi:hypothetical protein